MFVDYYQYPYVEEKCDFTVVAGLCCSSVDENTGLKLLLFVIILRIQLLVIQVIFLNNILEKK